MQHTGSSMSIPNYHTVPYMINCIAQQEQVSHHDTWKQLQAHFHVNR